MILMLGIFIASVTTFCLMIGDYGWQNLIVGSAIVASVMYVFRQQITPQPLPPVALSLHLLLYTPVLIYYLIIDILKGTWQVVMITLGFRPLRHPGIIKISFGNFSPYGVGPIGYFITLSPDSFMVDVDWEERVMLIHYLDASDPDALRRDADKYMRLWEYVPTKPQTGVPDLSTNPEDDDE